MSSFGWLGRLVCMEQYFRNRYRVGSVRAGWWDYNQSAVYHITVCTQSRSPHLARLKICNTPSCYSYQRSISELEPQSTNMHLNANSDYTNLADILCENCRSLELTPEGKAVEGVLQRMSDVYPNATLIEYVVMPDHIHLLLNVLSVELEKSEDTVDTGTSGQTTYQGGVCGDHNPMLHRNVSTIIRWLKSRVSREIRIFNSSFEWQPLFHDQIIRNEDDLLRVQNYIQQNQIKWIFEHYLGDNFNGINDIDR